MRRRGDQIVGDRPKPLVPVLRMVALAAITTAVGSFVIALIVISTAD